MIRCKCDFPTEDEYLQAVGRKPVFPAPPYHKAHRVHHDEWDATRNTEPTAAGAIVATSTAVHHELRIARLEAAVASLGVDLPVLGPVDAVLRQTATGRMEGQ